MYIFIYAGGVAPSPSAIHRERSARCTTSAAVTQNLQQITAQSHNGSVVLSQAPFCTNDTEYPEFGASFRSPPP